MVQILEKYGNITTTNHTDILNIFAIQPEFMFTGFFLFKNIKRHKLCTMFDRTSAYGSGNSAFFSNQHTGTGTSWRRS